MKFSIKILNGKRQGQEFILPSTGLYIYENEALEFKLSSDEIYDDVTIFFHETEIKYSEYGHNKQNQYVWRPKKHPKYGYECLFHNYFGIAELTLIIDDAQTIYQIEILATKLNALRTEKMLTFLLQEDSNVLWSFLRATRVNIGKSVGDISIDHSIEHLEKIVAQIELLLSKIINKPMVKVVPKTYYTIPQNNHNIDDTTLAWLCDNADLLFVTDNKDDALLEFNDEFYSIHSLKTNVLVNDTDIYENQVLHGFIHRLRLDTTNIISKLNTLPNNNYSKNHDVEYESLFNQLNKFLRKININKIRKCEIIIKKLDFLLYRLNKNIPTKTICKASPAFTQKVKHNFLYLSYFKKIFEWDRIGEIDWSITEELFAIKSIPVLFEYYLFFYIKKITENKLECLGIIDPNHSDIKFIFHKDNKQFNLEYQPKFWVKSHKEKNPSNLINSEKWSVDQYKKIKERSPYHKYSLRSPDIMLTFSGKSRNLICLIIDAKYTFNNKAFSDYLPVLTLKYLHGIHNVDSGKNHSIGLMIVNPSELEDIRHFHHDDYNIFSRSPILPALICSSIIIEEELHINNFNNVISKIIDLMEEKELN